MPISMINVENIALSAGTTHLRYDDNYIFGVSTAAAELQRFSVLQLSERPNQSFWMEITSGRNRRHGVYTLY